MREKITWNNIFHSFRIRIFILLVTIGIISSLTVGYSILFNYEVRAVSVKESEVSNQLMILANHLLTYNYLSDPSSEVVNAELEQLSNLYDGRVLIIGGNFKVIKDTYNLSVGRNIISKEVIMSFKGESMSSYDKENGFIELTIPITETIEDRNIVRGVMLISVSTDTIAQTLQIFRTNVWIIEAILAIFVFMLSMIFSKYLTAPFEKVTESLKNVSNGFSDDLVEVSDYKETQRIVEAFNNILSKYRALNESRDEFVANVSHELKTPITSVKLLAETLTTNEDTPIELYKEFMSDIVGEIDREDKIINDLLELVKLDKTNAELDIKSVNVNEMIESILRRLSPIAASMNVNLILESEREVTAQIDEVKLSLALTNIIENAIKYNRENGSVTVSLNSDHQNMTINVKDNGIGIPEESMAHIFERFYRVDKSHSREIGGTGLGLALARNIVIMHRGTIEADSVIDEGTVFTLCIPLVFVRENGGRA